MGPRTGYGIPTRDGLLGRHIALDGVAARMDSGAKAVQLSSRENDFTYVPCDHPGLKGWGRKAMAGT